MSKGKSTRPPRYTRVVGVASPKSKVHEHVKVRAYRIALQTLQLIDTLPNQRAY